MTRTALLIFSLPALIQGFMHAPAQTIIQGIYAKDGGLALAALGTAVLITRIFDAVTDPLIGWASDAWHRRYGTRKPFVVAGTFVTLLGLWFLFRPGDSPTLMYFTGWFLVAYLGWTLTEIPYRAWSFELSGDYVLRMRIQTWLGALLMIGSTLFYVVPYLAKSLGYSERSDFSFESLRFTALIVAVCLPLLNLFAVWRTPDGEHPAESSNGGLRHAWSAVIGNGPLLRLVAAFLLVGVLGSVGQGVYLLYFDSYMGLGEQFGAVMVVALPLSLLALPLWSWICQRYERHRVWCVALLGAAICYAALGFIPPGQENLPWVAMAVSGTVLFVSATLIVPLAMLGDAVDYGIWKFGQDFAGTYTSMFTLITKLVSGAGVAIGMILLGWMGFDATAQTQSESGALAMRLVVSWLPALGIAAVVPVIWNFPLTRERHRQIKEAIAARQQEA